MNKWKLFLNSVYFGSWQSANFIFCKKINIASMNKTFYHRSILRKNSQMPDSTHLENKILLFVMYKKFIFSIEYRQFSLFLFSRTRYTCILHLTSKSKRKRERQEIKENVRRRNLRQAFSSED